MDNREEMIMSATATSAAPERVPNHQSLIDTPAPLSNEWNMGNDGDVVYVHVGQSCTNEASDHRFTIENASSTDSSWIRRPPIE